MPVNPDDAVKREVEASLFLTNETVWNGVKPGSNDLVGTYTRVVVCDPTPTFTVKAV